MKISTGYSVAAKGVRPGSRVRRRKASQRERSREERERRVAPRALFNIFHAIICIRDGRLLFRPSTVAPRRIEVMRDFDDCDVNIQHGELRFGAECDF